MRDPGLLPRDLVGIALAYRPRSERGEVGARVGLGEDRGGEDLRRGDPGQVLLLLLVGAGAQDQLGGDLRAGAERADADVAARQLLGDHAHGLLAEAEPAVGLGDGEGEHAELPQLGQDLGRNIAVGEVPLVRVGHHLGEREAAHLVAHGIERLVEAGVAEGGGLRLGGDVLGQGRLAGLCAAVRHQVRHGILEAAHLGARHAQRDCAHRLALAHGDAAGDLSQVLAEGAAQEPPLRAAEAAGGRQPLRPPQHLPQRLHVGGKPRQPMPRRLLGIEPARPVDARPHRRAGMVQQALRIRDGLGVAGRHAAFSVRVGLGHGGHRVSSAPREAWVAGSSDSAAALLHRSIAPPAGPAMPDQLRRGTILTSVSVPSSSSLLSVAVADASAPSWVSPWIPRGSTAGSAAGAA